MRVVFQGIVCSANLLIVFSLLFEVVAALLIAKADVKTKNDEGKTALLLAAEGGHDETVRAFNRRALGSKNFLWN
jgi:ankyrin repeat protein